MSKLLVLPQNQYIFHIIIIQYSTEKHKKSGKGVAITGSAFFVFQGGEYSILCTQFDREELGEVIELMVDTLCSTSPTLRIGGGDIPTVQVKERLSRLDSSHIEYVFDCLHRNTTQIRNIRAYLLTALYNAPATINHYYQAEVQHDFG